MGKFFTRCRIQLKFRLRVRLKRWNDPGEFELDQARSKNNISENLIPLGHETHNIKKVIAKKPLTNLYEMDSSPIFYNIFKSIYQLPVNLLQPWIFSPTYSSKFSKWRQLTILALWGQVGRSCKNNAVSDYFTRLWRKRHILTDNTYNGGTGNRFDMSFIPLTSCLPPWPPSLALNESTSLEYWNREW